MPITADYHLHSSFSGDSQAPMESMIQRCIDLGFTDMCFTEHMDYDYPQPPGGGADFEVDLDAYERTLKSFQQMYASKIKVHFGIELGLQPHIAEKNASIIASRNFDFVIGSSHVCHRRDPYYPPFFEGRTEAEAYLEYFSSIAENIRSFSDFDVYGHLDYVVRYGENKDKFYHYEDYQDIFEGVLTLLIQKGKGIELNTGGIKYGLKDLHPCLPILKRYRELGGEIITVGSDAHRPENLGDSFSLAEEALKAAGFRYYTVFSERKPVFYKL